MRASSPENESPESLLLRMRAQRYARRAQETTGVTTDIVVFRRGEGRYAIALEALREIRPLQRLCRIPAAPPVVPGVFHYRGELMSAHDLDAYLSDGERSEAAPWVLIVEDADRRLGLMADEVDDVQALSEVSRLPLPVTLGERGACFSAVLDDGVLLVEPPSLFNTPAFYRAF